MINVDSKTIENFLNGNNPKQYVVGIEANYTDKFVNLIINDPQTGKRIEKHPYKPFIWFKEDVSKLLYNGSKLKAITEAQKYGVKSKRLKISDVNGNVPKRLENGYKFIATSEKSYNDLVQYFKAGGVDIFNKSFSKLFFAFTPVEQFMIQTGIRMFKGMEDYNDLHRFQFDLETEGLLPSKDGMFQIGMRDNRGFEFVLETIGDTPKERRESERDNIKEFFKRISMIQPDTITGYNSESFDWNFIVQRCQRLDLDITQIAKGLDGTTSLKRKPSILKLGNEMEPYEQTYMYGYNIIDIAHSVRRAQAINSDIKSWGLKYITKYSELNKENRVYVSGDKIHSTWSDTVNQYAFNNKNGDWYKISEKMPLKDDYEIKTGAFIVQRYLLDDLWETEQVDTIFNQAAFLIAKLLPTTYSRSSTMGTASQWKLIMAAWSYENNLAIPETEPKRDFTGGLSRLLKVGFAKNVVKFDYAALYPKNQLTNKIFPDLDISGVMEGLLTYVVDTRDTFKFLTGKHKKIAKNIQEELDNNDYSPEKIEELKAQIKENKALANLYDKKQLPLKILANSWFGAYGAPYIFNWGASDCAEETTCRGRQYLRLMVKHFHEKYNFQPLVGDSVTYDTPVYLRNKKNNTIDIQPICDLFNENSIYLDNEKLRDYEEKPYEILTRGGWKNIKYVYRHGTDKKIHRITTKDRMINVTEDHSLFQNGVEVKPSSLIQGDLIDTYEVPFNTNKQIFLTEDEAFLYGFFLGDGSSMNSKRKVNYTSKKTGEIKTYLSKRSNWKISNTKLTHLEKLKTILKDSFGVEGLIKNHLKSSGVHNLVVHNSVFSNTFCDIFYTSYREKKVPKTILNADIKIKKSFIEGVFASDGYGDTILECSEIGMKSQIAMSGIGLLLKELGIEYKIKTRKDKENFVTFILKNNNRNNSSFTEKTKKKTNEIWKNEIIINKDKNNFVYDVSTEDGTFICGINGIIAHNTDGFNFAFPDDIDNVKYIAKGNHWKTTEYAGKELSGLDAVLAEFNEGFMIGRMGLDIDDIYESTINFARKNYANLLDSKIKLVGNSIKSKKMPVYIEEFLQKAIKMLLNGKGYEFINYYYDYVDLIYNYSIPVVKIASKSKVKSNVSDYKKKAKTKNKAGNPMPRQAHMELAIINNLDVNLGDTIYYVNTGSSKGTGDIKTLIRSKMTKKEILDYEINNGFQPNFETELQINCELIDSNIVESNLELLKEIESLQKILLTETDEEKINVLNNTIAKIESELDTTTYNVAKYLEAFNKKVKPLLVCFNSVIREDVLLSIIKDKKTKLEKLKDRKFFTESECELVFGIPNKEGDQDTYEELMTMEDKEIKFWVSVNKTPNDIDIDKWEEVKVNYFEKKEIERIDGIKHEKVLLDNIFKKFEYDELVRIKNGDEIPHEIYSIGDFDFDNNSIVSIKWGGKLADITDILKYENEIFERNSWYELTQNKADDRYERWIDYKNNLEFYSGKTLDFIVQSADGIEEVVKEADINTKKLLPKRKQKKLVVNTEDEDDDDVQHQTIDDFSNNIQKFEFLVEVDNIKPVFDIIDAEEENEELIIETKPVEEEEDEWNF
jgi:DNA polymerase elongation subunit (family B)